MIALDVQALAIKVDVELSKVISFEKRQEVYNILHSECPDHYSRLWMVGFLKYCGYSLDEVCDIIHAEACWSDYDERTTYCQVASVFRSGRRNRSDRNASDKSSDTIALKDGSFLTRCVKDTPCSDSIDGYCFLISGEYNYHSTSEKNRRALNCFMDNQIEKAQRRKRLKKFVREYII